MSSEIPHKGEYAPPSENAVRSACPILNTMANHGYIPRSGQSVVASDFYTALETLGLSVTMRAVFSYALYNQRTAFPKDPASSPPPLPPATWWEMLSNLPWTAFRRFAMRPASQTNSEGVATLNLDQIDLHNVVEHDVSMTRRDAAQGDNHTIDRELLAQLLASSSDGKVITIADFAELRKKRYVQQQEANPKGIHFGSSEYQTACAEVALILGVFGDGEKVPVEYVRAVFQDERLPREEGWQKRGIWSFGLVEMNLLAGRVKKLIGFVPPVSETVVVAH